MTDGAYNTQHGAAYGDPSSAAVRISESAVKICRAMKDAGVVVYTVAFQIGGNSLATNTMENCASSPEHFYNSWTGDQLRQAFRDIALKVATLRIAG